MLHTAACEKLFVIGACDSHAPVGPAPPTPSHRRSAKSVTIAPAFGHSLWASWVTIEKHHRRSTIEPGHLLLWAFWVVKLKSVSGFCLAYPKRPQNRGAKNVGLSDEGCGRFGLQVSSRAEILLLRTILNYLYFYNFSV